MWLSTNKQQILKDKINLIVKKENFTYVTLRSDFQILA